MVFFECDRVKGQLMTHNVTMPFIINNLIEIEFKQKMENTKYLDKLLK